MSTKHSESPKVQATMRKVEAIMADQLTPLFKSGALLTVIVRFADNDEADFFMSDRQETISELRRFLDRCEKRDQLEAGASADSAASVDAQRLDWLEQAYTDGALNKKAWSEFMSHVAEVGYRAAIDAAIAGEQR